MRSTGNENQEPMSEPVPASSPFIDVVNAHDEEAFLDAFTPGGAVDDWGRDFTGREQIKTWSDKEFIGSTGVLTVEEVDDREGEPDHRHRRLAHRTMPTGGRSSSSTSTATSSPR
jgi:hypothetical protein